MNAQIFLVAHGSIFHIYNAICSFNSGIYDTNSFIYVEMQDQPYNPMTEKGEEQSCTNMRE